MSGPFRIEHKDGREYALRSLKVFHDRYEPEGFKIAKDQPYGWTAPKTSEAKDAPKAAEKAGDGTKGGDAG